MITNCCDDLSIDNIEEISYKVKIERPIINHDAAKVIITSKYFINEDKISTAISSLYFVKNNNNCRLNHIANVYVNNAIANLKQGNTWDALNYIDELLYLSGYEK